MHMFSKNNMLTTSKNADDPFSSHPSHITPGSLPIDSGNTFKLSCSSKGLMSNASTISILPVNPFYIKISTRLFRRCLR